MAAATQHADPAMTAQGAFRAASVSVSGKTVLSLFDHSGNWSRPYAEAGANVVQIDIKLGVDIMDLDRAWLTEKVLEKYGVVDGILAAPPCTDFASSGARYWPAKDQSGQTARSLELVRQVLRCVEFLKPDWWTMENPVGRLNTLLPELKKFGPWYCDPCDFGDPYTKRTGLWGRYTPPLPLLVGGDRAVTPVRACPQGSWMQKLGGKSEKTKTLRSATPMGFAYSFFLANCWDGARTLNP